MENTAVSSLAMPTLRLLVAMQFRKNGRTYGTKAGNVSDYVLMDSVVVFQPLISLSIF